MRGRLFSRPLAVPVSELIAGFEEVHIDTETSGSIEACV